MQIFSLFGEILLKDNGAVSKLDEIDKKGSKTGSSLDGAFKKIGSAALKVGGIIGAGLGFKAIIDNASASQQALSQMDTVLKSTGNSSGMTKKQLVDLADAQGKVTTFSKGTNIATENLLLTFTNIGQKTFPDALKAVNDMSQALGQDTKSSAIQLGKALNDPVKGITALSRVGVRFTDEQKKQIAAMQKAGNVAGAQGIILKELQKEFGGSAEAAGKTFGGQLTILKNQLTGVGTQIGMVVLPYLQNFVSKINEHMPQIKATVTDVINTVVPKVGECVKLIVKIAGQLLPSLGKAHKDAGGKAKDSAKNGLNFVVDALKFMTSHIGLVKAGIAGLTAVWVIQKGTLLAHNAAMAIHKTAQLADILLNGTDAKTTGLATAAKLTHAGVTKAVTAAQWLLNAAMTANPIGIVIAAIVALIAIGVLLYNKSTTFRNFVNAMWTGIKDLFVNILMPYFQGLVGIFTGIFGSILNSISKVFGNIKNIFSGIISFIKDVFTGNWKGAWQDVVKIFSNIFGAIGNVMKMPLNAIISGINGFLGGLNKIKIPDWVPGVGGKGFSIPKIPMLASGTDYFQGGYAIVGEEGPELVKMPKGSQVKTNKETMDIANNKQPIIIQLVLPNGKVMAEYLIDDFNKLFGSKNKISVRGAGA